MKRVNRQIQLKLLELMHDAYPERFGNFLGNLALETNYDEISFNLAYLKEHGLIHEGQINISVESWVDDRDAAKNDYYISGKISAAGIDFLEDDGGLSAILGTVTVRLHADTIRDLIETKIAESKDVPEEDKPGLIAALRGMREEGLKQLTQRVVSHGLDQAPGAWSAIIQALTS